MTWSNWLVFCGVSLFMAFTPGPAVLLAVSNSVSVGARRAMWGSLGNAVGVFLVSAVAMAGLGVLLSTSATAFMVLKLAGAAYLVYLGIRQWRSGTNAFADTRRSPDESAPPATLRLFGHGLTVALTNPKSILFFSALFPQFLTQGAPVAEQFFVLTATFAVFTVLSHAFYVLLARGMKHSFSDRRRVRLFNRVSGTAFVLLGLGMLRLRNRLG
ncbi:LysE family translocator [Variovorax saccharolyticus]|uniref:LysE family translocator n=1 Tax=Variovorax saccharolyticus TaxID=3053516 RepID=UPI002577FB2A|nr:LysE family translocator [Variovorax sp. J31P216]MDM0026291.1 LysE family translocator [Variovorax sp. J31P216]